MALIRYINADGKQQTFHIPWQSSGGPLQIAIGSDSQSDIQLSKASDVLPFHAMLTRARRCRLYFSISLKAKASSMAFRSLN